MPPTSPDITLGNNDYTPDGYTGGLYPSGTGYDMATGLGTPNGATLAKALCGGSAVNTVTVTNPGSQAMTVGTAVSLQVTATDSGGTSLTFSAAGPAGRPVDQPFRPSLRKPHSRWHLLGHGDSDRHHGRQRFRGLHRRRQPGNSGDHLHRAG